MSAQLTEAETAPTVGGTTEHATLAEALLAAQKEMPAVEPDAVNPHFGSSFVSLGRLISKVRPVLNRHGIAVVQMPAQDEAGKPTLITRLVHTSGEDMESTMPLMLGKPDPQALGSALTYAKRYALAAALAIADQDDDDGNSATTGAVLAAASDKQIEVFCTALDWLLPSDVSAHTQEAITAEFGGTLPGPVANAVIAVIKARKDSEQTTVEKLAAEHGLEPVESDLPAPDTEGLPDV